MENKRIEKLRNQMIKNNDEALLISSKTNQYYFSAYTGGEAYLIITQKKKIIITDFRYKEQLKIQSPEFEHIIIKNSLNEDTGKIIDKFEIKKIKIEGNTLYRDYKEISKNTKSELKLAKEYYNDIRIIKDVNELKIIENAQKIADKAFLETLKFIKSGVSEKEIDTELEYQMKKLGAQGKSFDFIIASGERSVLPHGTASDRIIGDVDILTIDFGALYKGYCSDCTRTIFIGDITSKQKKIYNIVKEAQEKALSKVKSGISAFNVDKVARDVIKNNGYGDKFGHGTGHGVGIDIHENPRLSPKTKKKVKLKKNMVVTIEPGIYIENEFGIRIEDMLSVLDEGSKVFTTLSKDIIIL